MKLQKARVQNFRSIEDTEIFDVNNLTCLVGKNEAGKTAILQAIEGQRPYSKISTPYDVTRDYPRRYLTQFKQRHPDETATVCTTYWQLSEKDKEVILAVFGEECLTGDEISIDSGYGFETRWSIPLDEKKSIEFLFSKFKLDASERNVLNKTNTSKELHTALSTLPQRTEKQEALLKEITSYRDKSIELKAIDLLSTHTPKFIYISHYDRMAGQISVEKLIRQKQEKTVTKDDEIFLSLLNLAGTSLDDLKDSTKYEDLKAKCEAASNAITQQIFEYWSQNDALSVQIDFSPGRAEDPEPFNSGTVVRARVWNDNHKASVPFSERSAGFVWFFSFLVKFAEIRNEMGNVIILLDEPGLTLHGKAQADLLRYIEEELLPHHQVVFSTHSPFLVPADRLGDIRIVEDVLGKNARGRNLILGTKVFTDPLKTTKDTIFPLQGAMGYDLCQSLFVGKHTILVEGPSDILYIQVISSALKKRGRGYLDTRWTLCPSGGIDKMQTFISLFAGNHLDVAVLADQAKNERSKIDRLKASAILNAGHAYSVADFTKTDEADVEDLIAPGLYVDILNSAFSLTGSDLLDLDKMQNADTSTTRQVKKAEAAFRTMTPNAPQFDHFSPAEWLLKHPELLENNTPEVETTLNNFAAVIEKFNPLLT